MGKYCFIFIIWYSNHPSFSKGSQLNSLKRHPTKSQLLQSQFWICYFSHHKPVNIINTMLFRLNSSISLSTQNTVKCLVLPQDEKSLSLIWAAGEKYFFTSVGTFQQTLLSGDKVSQYEVSTLQTEPPIVCRRANGWRWMPPLNHDSSLEEPQSMASLKVNVLVKSLLINQ